ncbi:sulfatase family protein [Pontiella sulfatireligans]|uniref:Choline-sulfatase n=1 Tax=Pontiella sulfatireligans TaxID=2750658 RepID=A0A6C2UER2_9BACT|nr:sulfatase [Pontiella sulfatireligans]SPS74226.1 sulfatase S1_8 [Kiritimatiellales bacterium]VGO18702.1 Choline-sulfatase [Pontiella sulfatireligans]
MKKLTILFGLLFGACLAFADNQPNMMFILADDCTFRDLELYGGPAKTPHINKLAAEGMTFSRCYQAAPMCSPTRNNLYTGVYPVKSGAYPNHTFVYSDVKSIPHYLKEQGYRVALIGKVHVGPKKNFPFEYIDDFGAHGAMPEGEDELSRPVRYPEFDAFVKECTESGTPFCIFATSNEPHGPYDRGDATQYRNGKHKMPANLVDTPKTREEYARYLAEITYFDGQVGECISMLSKYGVKDKTLIMVATEQGSSFPYGKWTTYENGVASGLVARWPGKIAAGSKSDAIVEYCDVVPTLLKVAGAPIPKAVEGLSFLPVLIGESTTHKDYSYSLHTTVGVNGFKEPYGTRSVVSKRYRYIRNLTPEGKFTVGPTRRIADGKEASGYIGEWVERANDGDKNARALIDNYIRRPAEELYDIIADPYCRNNLAANPENSGILKEHAAKLDAWMKQQGDKGAQTELDAKYRCTKLDGKGWKNNERPSE